MGSMEFASIILEALHEKYPVSLVVTQPDKPVGRKKVLMGTPVKEKAMELGIEIFQPVSIRKDNQRILSEEFDFIIVAAYGQLIPESILYHAKHQAINVHASLLPKYRGGSPMHRAIINGDKITGVTIMYMEKALDSGSILNQEECEITEEDNVKTLEIKLANLGKTLLLETINKFKQGTVQAVPQNDSLVSYAYNFKPHELRLSFNKTAEDFYNQVRGMNPWPISEIYIDQQRIKVYEVDYLSENFSTNVKEVVKIDKSGVYIQCASGVVILKEIQLAGKKKMDIVAFMNGIGKSLFIEGEILNTSL
jgi:methionyl-tRNA formyltransferase